MNKKQVSEAYKVLLQASNGAQRVKVDLHVHTPASHDFVCLPLQDAEAYINVLDQAIEQDIGIIAITDHNTFAGVRYIRKLLKDPEQSKKYGRLLILCGIEITCFSKHLIAIFPETFDEKMQDKFLDEIGIDESARGSEDALADNLGPALLIDKISANNGFAILAHADSNKGFLQNMCGNRPQENELSFSGKSLAKIVQNKGLLAVQCNSDKNAKTLKTKLKNKEYNREFNALAFLKCSDCHGVCINGEYNSSSGSPLGKFYSIIKLSELSFEALKMALLDSEMRVDDNSVQTNYAYIEGVAVKSRIFGLNNECKYFRFCNELNCIIGSRGTGKTTLLEIIQSVIMPNSFQDIDRNRAYSKYNSAVVFLKIEDKVYAIASEPKKRTDSYGYEVEYQPEIKIYSKDKNSNNFKPYNKDEQDEFLKRFLTAGYQQRQLYDYSKDPQKILGIVDDFLNWRNCSDFRKVVGQISYQVNELDGLLKRIKKERFNSKSRFSEYVDTYGHVRTIVGMISRIGDLKINVLVAKRGPKGSNLQ